MLLGLFSADRQESDVSFEELEDNDHLRVQKRQIGGNPNGNEKELDDAQKDGGSPKGNSRLNSTEGNTRTDDTKDNTDDNAMANKYKKKALFDSDLVQLDLFSPFPIALFNSSYLKK